MSRTEIVIVMQGGQFQGLFCSETEANVTLVDRNVGRPWTHDPHVVRVLEDGRPFLVRVTFPEAEPLADLAGTDIEQAIDEVCLAALA